MHRVERVNTDNFFFLSPNSRTQGVPLKLMGSRFMMDKRKYFLTQWVIKFAAERICCWKNVAMAAALEPIYIFPTCLHLFFPYSHTAAAGNCIFMWSSNISEIISPLHDVHVRKLWKARLLPFPAALFWAHLVSLSFLFRSSSLQLLSGCGEHRKTSVNK